MMEKVTMIFAKYRIVFVLYFGLFNFVTFTNVYAESIEHLVRSDFEKRENNWHHVRDGHRTRNRLNYCCLVVAQFPPKYVIIKNYF